MNLHHPIHEQIESLTHGQRIALLGWLGRQVARECETRDCGRCGDCAPDGRRSGEKKTLATDPVDG